MGEDRGNRPRIAAGRLRSPGTSIEVLEDELVDPIVDRIGFEHRPAKIGS
jgi:hypothetical protein